MTQETPRSPLIEQVEKFKAGQSRREVSELRRLVDAYQVVYTRTQDEVEAFLLKLEKQAEAGEAITPNQVRKMARYRQLLEEIEDQVNRYSQYTGIELNASARLAIGEGQRDALKLVELAANGQLTTAELRALNPEVIEQLVGFLAKDGALWKNLDGLGAWTSDQVGQAILEGIGLGQNPRTIAQAITKSLGMGLTQSLQMMRTVQLWSYREANRASYGANSDVVTGWVWLAELDEKTCASCIAMHGTEHPLDEPLNDHHNGRCTMVPMTVLSGNPVEQTGEAWFTGQSEKMQKDILGGSMWDAWKEGKFTLADIPGTYQDEVYGEMRAAKTLKELLGEPTAPAR